MLLPRAAGWQLYVITGTSMTGTIPRGSLVWADVVVTDGLRVGDVITYRPPPGSGPAGLVTHRIVSMRRGDDGRPVFRTKGDHNAAADPWLFTLGARQARIRGHLPHAGRLVAALSQRPVRMLLIGLPALLIALGCAAELRRCAGTAAAPATRERR
jgi:signal peptidase